MRLRAMALAAFATVLLASPGSAYTSFSVDITWAYAFSARNTISVRATAFYRDTECRPAATCDRNVTAEFALRRGSPTHGPVVARAYDRTGPYGSMLSADFRTPSCRLIPRGHSQPYTVVLTAAAPSGERRATWRTLHVRSCL